MRGVTARAVVAALVAGVLSPVPLALTAQPAAAATYGQETVVASSTETIRGAAALPDGTVVYTTADGWVWERAANGTVRVRTYLTPLSTRGKVALGADRTAYVVTDAGAIARIPANDVGDTLTIPAWATDVEVEAAGTLLVADRKAHRVLRVPASGGTGTVVASLPTAPQDLALDGTSVVVAGGGLRRIAAGGAVTTLLTGGDPTIAAPGRDGIWTNPDHSWGLSVLAADGALRAVRADNDDAPIAQVQAVGNGNMLVSGGNSVRLVTDPGLAAVAPFSMTAAPGEGRISLRWDDTTRSSVEVRAKQGSVPPRDRWDGIPVGYETIGAESSVNHEHVVLRIGEHVLQEGEQWSFAAFAQQTDPLSEHMVTSSWSPPATATSGVLADTTPPEPPYDPTVSANRTAIYLAWSDLPSLDFDHSVVRMALGTTPPATPDEGIELGRGTAGTRHGVYVPDPVPGQNYALSIFSVDLHGNHARWSTVARLDLEPPAPVADLEVTPQYFAARVSATQPADADFDKVEYAIAPGSEVPSRVGAEAQINPDFWVRDLTMGTDYTLALWSVDRNGNASEPAVVRFTTLLDTQPPAPVTDLTVTGGDYRLTAAWTPPADADLAEVTARLTDEETGAVSTVRLAGTATGHTWQRLPGGRSYTVTVTAIDEHGLVSAVSSGTGVTDPDADGAPPAIDLATVSVTPASSASVRVQLPRPTFADFKGIGYAVLPLGEDPQTVTTTTPIEFPILTDSATVYVALPQAVTPFQLVLVVEDLNGHRTLSVVPQVAGVPNSSELPAPAANLTASSPLDNVLDVSWSVEAFRQAPATWTVTAVSGSASRTVTVPGTTLRAALYDLPGRRDWTVSVVGNNHFGPGPVRTTSPVRVADDSPPARVTGATQTPDVDTTLLRWTNPTDVDLDRVEVLRTGGTAAETQLVYRGTGTSVRATGLLPGRRYTFQIRTFDQVGNVAAVPVTLTAVESTLTLAGARTITFGGAATLSGVLSWNGKPAAGYRVTVQTSPVGSTTWTPVATVTTSGTGTFGAAVRPALHSRYRVAFAGAGGMGGAYSSGLWVKVAPGVSIASSRTSLTLGQTVTLSTKVAPGHAGRTVYLQRLSGSTWTTVATSRLSSTSAASAVVRPPTRGTNLYRWVILADTDHEAGYSAVTQIRVS
jgi:hypothetical protein